MDKVALMKEALANRKKKPNKKKVVKKSTVVTDAEETREDKGRPLALSDMNSAKKFEQPSVDEPEKKVVKKKKGFKFFKKAPTRGEE